MMNEESGKLLSDLSNKMYYAVSNLEDIEKYVRMAYDLGHADGGIEGEEERVGRLFAGLAKAATIPTLTDVVSNKEFVRKVEEFSDRTREDPICEGHYVLKDEEAPEGKSGWPGSWKWANCKLCNGYFKVSGFCSSPEKCNGGTCPKEYACNH